MSAGCWSAHKVWNAYWVPGCPQGASNAHRVLGMPRGCPGCLQGAGDACRVPGMPAGYGDAHTVPGMPRGCQGRPGGAGDAQRVPGMPAGHPVPGLRRGSGATSWAVASRRRWCLQKRCFGAELAARVTGNVSRTSHGDRLGVYCHRTDKQVRRNRCVLLASVNRNISK